MTVAEETPISTLLQQRVLAATLGSALLLPISAPGDVLPIPSLPIVSEVALRDRDSLAYVCGLGTLPGTAVLSAPRAAEVVNIASRLRDLTALPVSTLAIALDVTRQAFYGWLDNQRIASERLSRLERLERTFVTLVGIFGPGDTLRAWLQHESELGQPLQLLREQRDDIVIGLTLTRPARRVPTSRGRVAQTVRRRANATRREIAYHRYSLTATEDPVLASDVIEAGEILGYIRAE